MTIKTSIYEYAKQALSISADQPAIWFYDKSMTYRELFEKIDNVANHLAQLGVKEGTVVTIHLPNCPQAVMAIYAVAKLGAICNMVHPQMPEEALKENLRFAESNYLISYNHSVLERRIAEYCIHADSESYMEEFPDIDDPMDHITSFSVMTYPCPVCSDGPKQKDLAEKCAVYMHSAGTTGTPKTVMLSHKAINAWAENVKNQCYRSALHEMVFLNVAPLFHCFGFAANMHVAVSYGAQAIILERWNSDAAVAAIKKHHVSYIANVPTMFRDLLRNPGFCGPEISCLTYCMMAGEAVPPELIEELDARICNGRVARSYIGATEVCGAFCGIYLPEHDIRSSGYSLKGSSMMVRDFDGSMCAVGKGEVLVSSESLMIGYLKDTATTKDSLISYGGELWFKTGDYGEIRSDGALYFISRIKEIIKRKGYNVFPVEVEKVIAGADGVSQVCVIGVPDEENATEKVCAVVVPESGYSGAEIKNQILAECRKYLPRYAIPGKIVFADRIPLNQVGKMDRKALKELL